MAELGVLRPPREILFGAGAAAACGRLAAAHGRRVLVCTDDFFLDSPQLEAVLASLRAAGSEVEVLAAAVPELPLSAVEEATDAARRLRPDCLVGLGGGSCLDLAKLIALGLTCEGPLSRYYGEGAVPSPTLPVVALPTTAGTGSEVTPVAVLTDPGRELKVGISSPHLIPVAAICDPDLTHGAPAAVTADAGIDALAHAVEAYCAIRRPDWDDVGERVFVGGNSLSDVFALRAIELIAGSLRDAVGDLPDARVAMLEGSLCAGLAFASAGTTLAHALQYPIGARTSTPHGLGIGLLLPYTMAFNAAADPIRMASVAAALGAGGDAAAAVAAVASLAADVGIPATLAELGIEPAELPGIAEQAVSIERLILNNPRPVGREEALAVLEAAQRGGPLALLGAEGVVR